MLVLGLLQTESYARALTRSAHPFAAEEVIEGMSAPGWSGPRSSTRPLPPCSGW
ncbi:DUF5753 domain-containing protein [Streptomyces sp. NBC_01696]|uniref:hypothetical protein n=1 Tax=unclassified Streptomyces TaxID=2593676 RepID=UPI002E340F6B|nr:MULTISPECIES: hypothetical protein [unclassified Streptomyces]